MPRYTGWRRLSGDTAARPDLLDLGKRLLGELEVQRQLSGVKTCSVQRTTPDGSVVTARFIGDIPSIDVVAARPRTGGGQPVFALRVFAEVWNVGAHPTNRYLSSLDLDLYTLTPRFVQKAARANVAVDLGTVNPRANICVSLADNPPVDVKSAHFFGATLVSVVNDAAAVYDERLQFIGNIRNIEWDAVHEQATTNRRFADAVPIPGTKRLVTLGHASRASGPFSAGDSLWVLDAQETTVIAARRVDAILAEPNAEIAGSNAMQAAPDGTIFTCRANRIYTIAPDLSGATSVLFPGTGFGSPLLNRAGTRLYLFRRISGTSPPEDELLAVDTSTMTLAASTTVIRRSFGPFYPWCLAPSGLYLCAQDGVGNEVVEVRDPDDLTLIHRFPYTSGSDADRGFIVAPDASRIYVDRASGVIDVLSTTDGSLMGTVDPNALAPWVGTGAKFKQNNNDIVRPLGFHAAR